MTLASTANVRAERVLMNSFLFSGTLASRNYVIRLFGGCANDLVYLDSSEFHVGKNRGREAKNVGK